MEDSKKKFVNAVEEIKSPKSGKGSAVSTI